MWNRLGKAIQKSRNSEQQTFWIDHKASLQVLVKQTTHSAEQFDGRATATVTHSLVKILHLTNTKSLGVTKLWSLWIALLRSTIRHIQKSDGFNAHDISNLIWAYAKAGADEIIKVDGRLLDAICAASGTMCGKLLPRKVWPMSHGVSQP
jgi:hypothetical protein